MKAIHGIAFVLLVIGGLNWFLVGIGVGDVVAYLGSTLATIVYILVGLSAFWLAFTHKGSCKFCEKSSAPAM
ncbi:DUF378 domain-containing protein [Patescibacteria group bacterium]|nr:DUF378 domain-containing protein [Patescibacteria group bacterium]MDE1946924.1 DUF378 domain-containing protein [Patescibacteria group bacterium]MDE2011125.1 DUF378 domain-containing protein [Patescibacteria group bacterium]MDE2233184.1 DUF378 domain-containing protein [Patescibacteria group bacterium]